MVLFRMMEATEASPPLHFGSAVLVGSRQLRGSPHRRPAKDTNTFRTVIGMVLFLRGDDQ